LMSPTGAVAGPDCLRHPNHKSCSDPPDPVDDSSASYEIAVFLGDLALPSGTAENVDGSGNESRPKIGNTIMKDFDLTEMRNAMATAASPTYPYTNGYLCQDGDFNSTGIEITAADGEFGFSTSTIPKTSLTFTYITASFWNFTVNGSNYFLVFGPDEDDPEIGDEGNWPPDGVSGDSNTMLGTLLELKVINGPAKKGPCDKLTISLAWEILVIKE